MGQLCKTVNFKVYEYIGVSVYKVIDGVPVEKFMENENDLTPGMEIAVSSPCGGFHIMTVEKDGDGFSARNEHLMAVLRFAQDDRKCWVCIGLINPRGISKLDLKT